MTGVSSAEWAAFLEDIRGAKRALGASDVVWYRGHANSKFYLLASLLRYKNGLQKERELFVKFRKFSDKILKRRDSEWETLFDMQHHGVPTRLLDWTETFGIALFFAATYNQSHHRGEDAAIYLLNPSTLNRISGIQDVVRVPQDEAKLSYTKVYWDHNPFMASAPIAVEPIFSNDRMLAQRGVFTVHHDEREPLETEFPSAIKKVVLPHTLIPAALEFLELSNINMLTVFPDLAGLSGYLDSTSGLER